MLTTTQTIYNYSYENNLILGRKKSLNINVLKWKLLIQNLDIWTHMSLHVEADLPL